MAFHVPSSSWWPVVAFALALIVVLQWLTGWGRRRSRRERIVTRVRTAVAGEHAASAWLEELGFEILGAQVAAQYAVLVDGEEKAIGIRADYLVARDRRRFVVEVKTGDVAPRIETSATRRQLLEYLVAFEVDGVLLLDMQKRAVHEVEFPQLAPLWGNPASATQNARGGWLGWMVGAAGLAALVVYWLGAIR